MKDAVGNEVNAGDILLEYNTGRRPDNYPYSNRLWEMPEYFDGHAYFYTIDGSRHLYAWASIHSSEKIDISSMPDNFEFSFKHGMSDIYSKIEYGTPLEVVENSNWKEHEVKGEEVEQYEFIKTLQIETIDDIVKNAHALSKGYIPTEVVSKVLSIAGVGMSKVTNGEIGIAGMSDLLHYRMIIEALKQPQLK